MSRAFLADAVLVLHAAFVLFVVGGLAAIWIGEAAGMAFARNRTFRIVHLAAIGFVVAETLAGFVCPLTQWEAMLRSEHGATRGFLQRAISAWLYWELPAWVFDVAYTAFGALVAWTWWRLPPRPRRPL